MGTLTGAGGGVLRDVLINEVPLIFRKEIYAISCVLGGGAYWIGQHMGLAGVANAVLCAVVVVAVRLLAVKYKLRLPILKGENQ